MPPKKDATAVAGGDTCIAGFDARETKWLAAAFVASIGPNKFDNKLFADLAKSTPASVAKLFPPIKRKATEAHPSLATYLGISANGDSKAAAPKANGSKKRKLAETDSDNGGDLDGAVSYEKEKPKAKGKGHPKKAKKAREQEWAMKDAEFDNEI